MRKIFICSPYRGDVKANMERAERYCRYAMLCGELPIAPHLYFTRFLDDAIEVERRMGLFMGAEMLKDCSELWAFGSPTEGMREEIELAQRIGILVRFFDANGRELT